MRRSYHVLVLTCLLLLSVAASTAIAAPLPEPPQGANSHGDTPTDPPGGSSLQRLDESLNTLHTTAQAEDLPADGITRRVYRRTYTRYYTAPRHVVIVQRPATTTIVTHASDPPIYALPHRKTGIDAGLRFSTISLGDTSLKYETFEGATLVGVGGYLRGMFDPHWGLEISVDVLGADEVSYSQFAVPVMTGLVLRLFPGSILDIYGVAGGGLIFNNIEYYGGNVGSPGVDESFIQLTGQLAAGIALNLGSFQVTSDLRWLFMQARPERELNTRLNAPLQDTQATPASDLSDVTNGLQFTLGVGGSF